MTRHGKNCTAGAVYTYHEKRKDTAASGYGTQKVRLGRDALRDFDCCCLSLQPCRDPVVTPDGFLYEREAILQYIVQQRARLAKEKKAYLRQRAQLQREEEQRRRAGEEAALKGFLQAGGGGGAPQSAPQSQAEATPGPSGTLPSFWIPSLTPEAGAERLRKPVRALQDTAVRCPMSGRRLRASDLVPVRFTAAVPGLPRLQLLGRTQRYVCAVSRDALSNATPCAVLRPSGAVVTMQCVERLIRKEMRDPLSGEALSEADIIPLQRGGTGFAGAGTPLEAQKSRPVMQA